MEMMNQSSNNRLKKCFNRLGMVLESLLAFEIALIIRIWCLSVELGNIVYISEALPSALL